MNTNVSRHASQRLQQRGIPSIVIELLAQFGTSQRCDGADKVFFDKESRKRLRKYMGGSRSMRHIEPWLDVMMVVSDTGAIVTVAHRTKRISRH